MGWRAAGAAAARGEYTGGLVAGQAAAGRAKGFANAFEGFADALIKRQDDEEKAELAFEREKDLIRLRETLAAQRAAATASRTRDADDGKALAWAVATVNSYGLANTPANVTRLAGLYTSEGSEVQAGNAVDALIVSGALTLAPTDTSTTVPEAPAPVEPIVTVSSQNTTELPSVFNPSVSAPVTLDNLEATETAVPSPPPVETETPTQEDPEVTPAPTVPQPTSLNFANLTLGQGAIVRDLRGQDIDELRMTATTSDPNSFQGQAARQLYQDSRVRQIQATAEEATLLTILQNGEDWEREAAREVLQNMGSSNEISRFKILPEGASSADLQTTGADVINVRMVRGEDGRTVPVDVATGEPIDPARVVGPVTQDESERLVAILTAMNNPITAYQSQRNNFLAFADLSYEIGQMIEQDETVTTNVAGFVSTIVSGGREASAIYNVLSSTFSNDANAVVTQQDLERELRRNGTLENGETLDALASRLTVEDIFSNQTIDLAERRRVFEAKMVLAAFRAGGMEGQSGQAMSDKDFQRFTQFLNSARTEEGFRQSVGDYLSNGFRQTVQMENNLLNDGRVTEFRSMYFRDPLNLTTMATAVEAEPRYRDALAYFGMIDAPQQAAAPAQSPEPQQATTPVMEQPNIPENAPIPIGYGSVEAFLSNPDVIAAAEAAGVTPEDIYRVYFDQNQGTGQ